MEEIGLWAGFILTLMVYSYILGDNALYRLAVYVFAGLAAGYITIVTVESILIPWFDSTLRSGDTVKAGLGMLPVLLGVLLLFNSSKRFTGFGNLGIALVVGVGTAVALVGALTGTLIPLAIDTAGREDVVEQVAIFIGVATSLIYFQYLARRRPDGEARQIAPVRVIGFVGQGFIVVTLGALYAAAILTSLTIFSERIGFVLGRILGG
jgi:hypothetical protein